jgi:hypothetical protein
MFGFSDCTLVGVGRLYLGPVGLTHVSTSLEVVSRLDLPLEKYA